MPALFEASHAIKSFQPGPKLSQWLSQERLLDALQAWLVLRQEVSGLPFVLGRGSRSNDGHMLPLKDMAVPTNHQATFPGMSQNCSYQAKHGNIKASNSNKIKITKSNLTRAIGSATVTVPSIIYLLQPNPNKHHGHGHDEGKHEDQEGKDADKDKPEGEAGDGEQAPGAENQEGENSEGTSDDRSTTSRSGEQPRPDHTVYDAGQGTPETSGDEDPRAGAYEVDSGGNVEGVRFKGATSGGTKEGEQGDTRKHIPDAKGGAKKRIQSDYAKTQGVSQDDDKDASKGASNVHSGQQEGISNTDTKHSTDLDNNPEKSKKGEGFVETAKMKGPVDPSRPQVCLYCSYIDGFPNQHIHRRRIGPVRKTRQARKATHEKASI